MGNAICSWATLNLIHKNSWHLLWNTETHGWQRLLSISQFCPQLDKAYQGYQRHVYQRSNFSGEELWNHAEVNREHLPLNILSLGRSHTTWSNVGDIHFTTRDLSNMIRNIRGQILTTGDFSIYNYLGAVTMLTPGWSHCEIHWYTQSVCSQCWNPHISETSRLAWTNHISDWPHNRHTRTCSEMCVVGTARYQW